MQKQDDSGGGVPIVPIVVVVVVLVLVGLFFLSKRMKAKNTETIGKV